MSGSQPTILRASAQKKLIPTDCSKHDNHHNSTSAGTAEMNGRALIFYHSASGNTRWVSRKLSDALDGCGFATSVRSIASQPDTADVPSYNLVGFGCPVMGFRPSFALVRFIQALPFQAQTPAFIFTTYAGVLANTPWMLATCLRNRGFSVLAHKHFHGEVSWPVARCAGLIVNRGLPDERQLPSINRFAGQLATLAVAHTTTGPAQPTRFSRSWLNPFYYLALINSPARLRIIMGRKRVNTTRCNKCGLCAKQCAAGAISMSPYPSFNNYCDGCWGCFNICPNSAISTIVGTRGRYCDKFSSRTPSLL